MFIANVHHCTQVPDRSLPIKILNKGDSAFKDMDPSRKGLRMHKADLEVARRCAEGIRRRWSCINVQ